jgi:hypothetical protein
MKNNERCVFIGAGFINNQIPWVLPIVIGYCKKNNINNIVFDRKIEDDFLKKDYLTNDLKNFKILYLSDFKFYLKFKSLAYLFSTIKFLFQIVFFTFFFNKKYFIQIFKNSNKKNIRLFHNIWDTSILFMNNKSLHPNIFNKLKAAILFFYFKQLSILLKTKKICAFFLNHDVYYYQQLYEGINKKKEVYVQVSFSFYKQKKETASWNASINKNIFFKIKKKISKKNISNYFCMRQKGKGLGETYGLTRYKKFTKNNIINNIIFLHAFRDSPYLIYDQKRIFIDYYDWIFETLNLIRNSQEKWLLKIHPAAKLWGEDQFMIVNNILKKLNLQNNIGKNIFFDNSTPSWILLKNAKRVVTFNGTVHAEAVSYGIRPIIISKCPLNFYSLKSTLKPKNISEYGFFLKQPSTSKIFRSSNKEIELSRFFVYFGEMLISLRNDLNLEFILKGDNKNKLDKDLKNSYFYSKKKYDFLNLLGANMQKYNCTMSQKLFNIYNSFYIK